MPSPSPAASDAPVRRARALLGTLVQISAAGPLPAGELHAAIGRAFAEVARVHALMSRQEPDSELSRLNRCAAAGAQAVHADTLAVLQAALRFAHASHGAFDPSFGQWRHIELVAGRVRFHRPLQIDLGGIAKGYAVDLAVQELKRAGATQILVAAGGDLRASGPPQAVGLRDPRDPAAVAHAVQLEDAALASSSASFSRRIEHGREVSDLVDPRRGSFYTGWDGISVQAPDCMTADALTKVVLFAAPEMAEGVLASHGARAFRLQLTASDVCPAVSEG